jgi:hypothetical protein
MRQRFTLTLDAADPKALGTFWATALGYVEEPPPKPYASWRDAFDGWKLPSERWNDAYAVIDPEGVGPRFFLQKVPEPKTAKNRLHLDVWVPGETRENPASPDDKRALAAHLVEPRRDDRPRDGSAGHGLLGGDGRPGGERVLRGVIAHAQLRRRLREALCDQENDLEATDGTPKKSVGSQV